MPINVGVLGFAHGHVGAIAAQWRQRPELHVAVAAGWDHDAARLKTSTEGFGCRACSEVEEILSDSGIQAVFISAETSRHAELAERAAAAGKAIICYKPMALTLSEADRIVAAVEKNGVPFTMGWQMRVDPQNVKMKELVTSGELGRIFMVRRRHGLSMCLNPAFADSWHVDPKANRDIWADDASHAIDFIHWLLGVPETVTAEIDSLCNPRMPNDNGIALFRYPGGPVAEVCSSFSCPAGENTTEIVGEKGVALQNYGDGVSCNVPRPEGGIALKWFLTENNEWTVSELGAPPSHGDRIANQAAPMSKFLHGDGPPIATAEEGRTSLRMMLACYVSTREGRRVRLDDEAIAAVE